jgi:hypothetical protein
MSKLTIEVDLQIEALTEIIDVLKVVRGSLAVDEGGKSLSPISADNRGTIPAVLPAVSSSSITEEVPVSVKLSDNLDTEGIPWDGRIHSTKKTKCADGTWKLIRGVDKSLVAELKPILKKASEEVVAKDTGAPPMPPPVPPTPITFQQLVAKIAPLLSDGTLQQDKLKEIVQKHGVPEFTVLATRSDLLLPVATDIEALCNTPV